MIMVQSPSIVPSAAAAKWDTLRRSITKETNAYLPGGEPAFVTFDCVTRVDEDYRRFFNGHCCLNK